VRPYIQFVYIPHVIPFTAIRWNDHSHDADDGGRHRSARVRLAIGATQDPPSPRRYPPTTLVIITKANLHAVNTNRFNAQPPSYSPLSPRTHGTHQHSGPPHRTSPAGPPAHSPWSATPPQTAPPRYPTQQHYRRTNEPTSSVSERTSVRAYERTSRFPSPIPPNLEVRSQPETPARPKPPPSQPPSPQPPPLPHQPNHTSKHAHPTLQTRRIPRQIPNSLR